VNVAPSMRTIPAEVSAQPVAVAAFCIDATEVRVGDCDACKKPRSVEFERLSQRGRDLFSQYCNGADHPDHPANCIDWNEAAAHCKALGKRLPTEAEWELAARGAERREFPWGDAPPSAERLNACGPECAKMMNERQPGKEPWTALYEGDDRWPATAPVGSYPKGATPQGVLDLGGNVWEWTQDTYCPYSQPECGESRRVIRGGGWDTQDPLDLRAARRLAARPVNTRSWSIGFRCARDL
jgi:formylglycine-generating enzyme required for sulfatase activity